MRHLLLSVREILDMFIKTRESVITTEIEQKMEKKKLSLDQRKEKWHKVK